MTAIEAALAGLIDYAGLYPPAALEMRAAVRNYVAYGEHKRAWVLGRFIVDIARLGELREAAGGALNNMPLSILAAPDVDAHRVAALIDEGFAIEALEMKCADPAVIAEIGRRLPAHIERYFEVPIDSYSPAVLDALSATGSRAKLRTGGVIAEAFPDAESIVSALAALAARRVAFKATAGLHHPVRARHRLTYAADSPSGTMHGFVNLLCAAAAIRSGGDGDEARALLEEEDAGLFCIAPDFIAAGGHRWSAEELREVRQFFTGFGSCSFTEPICDLEALGWL